MTVVHLRTSTNPVITNASRALETFNSRHPWSHNDHFHGWILRHLPERRARALDVGCGHGELLARLAGQFESAHGTDLSPEMVQIARRRCRDLPNVTVDGQQLTEMEGPYDVVTMVAVLHHLNTDDALRQVRRLLSPGGRFLMVGLTQPTGVVDELWDLAGALSNPIIGLIKHPRRSTTPVGAPAFPVKDPTDSLTDVRRAFDVVMPGSRLRRREGFRYTASWTKPT